jgi:hypothetical protein
LGEDRVTSRQSWHASIVPQHETHEVLWLGSVEAPQQLQVHLRGRGFSLCVPESGRARPAARLSALEASTTPLSSAASLKGRRLAMVHPDPGAADAVAQALRAKGAEVVILSLNPGSLDRALVLGPHAVLMESGDFYGACWELVRALWQHPRLCFTPLLLSQLEGRGLDDFSALDTQGLCTALDALCAEHDRVLKSARVESEFSVDLAELGPARLLRVLVESGRSLRASFSCPGGSIDVDLTEHVIVGASASGAEACLGPYALALLLKQQQGSVQVRRVEHPAVTNIIAPLDTALDAADRTAQATPVGGTRNSIEPAPPVSLVRLVPKAPENDQAARAASRTPQPAPSFTSQATLHGIQPPRTVAVFPPPAPGTTEPPPPIVKTSAVSAALPPVAAPALAAPPLASAPVAVPPVAAAPLVAALPAPLPQPVAPPAPVLQLVVDNTQAPDAFTHGGEPEHRAGWLEAVPAATWRRAGLAVALALIIVVLALVVRAWLSGSAPTEAAPAQQPSAVAVAGAPPATPPASADLADEDDPTASRESEHVSSAKARSRQASKLVSQGHSFRRAGLHGSARRRYEEALAVFPEYPRALAGLAQVALAQGKNDEALEYARRLRKERPRDAHYQKLIAEIQSAATPRAASRSESSELRRGNRARLSP